MRAAASCSDPRRVRSGARTLVEIGDPHRFDNPGRLAAYAGLAPVDWQSGRHSTTRRARGGNHRLKNAMFQAAFVATQHDPDARACYLRKRAEGKRHNAAVICVARRRCNIILAMVKTRTPLPTPTTRKTPKSAPGGLTTRQGHPPTLRPRSLPRPEHTAGRHQNVRHVSKFPNGRPSEPSTVFPTGPGPPSTRYETKHGGSAGPPPSHAALETDWRTSTVCPPALPGPGPYDRDLPRIGVWSRMRRLGAWAGG